MRGGVMFKLKKIVDQSGQGAEQGRVGLIN